MRIAVLMFIVSGMAFSQAFSSQGSTSAKELIAATPDPSGLAASVNLAPDLPPMPRGKATVIGGSVRSVDQLRDELTLNVYGGHPMKIFFDQRTHIFRDGQPASLNDLRPGEHISVETLLDGDDIFARSIHSLTQSIDGQCHGQVLTFDAAKRELLIRDGLAPEPIKVQVPPSATIVGEGQQTASPTALARGALVAVTFRSDGNGRAIANKIAVLASPGSAFVFNGIVSYLDVHRGVLVLVDSRDQSHYEISFDPRSPIHSSLREGQGVTVTAGFNGEQYAAKQIVIHPPASK
jgi:hypothetical protein